jgi:hypothetical protein
MTSRSIQRNIKIEYWAINSAARVSLLHGESRGFESLIAHSQVTRITPVQRYCKPTLVRLKREVLHRKPIRRASVLAVHGSLSKI